MRHLAAEKVNEDVLRSIWMQRLPTSMQQIPSVSSDNLNGLSLIADKFNDISHFDTVVNSVASDNLAMQSLRNEIWDLRAEIKRISLSRFRQTSRYRQENSKSRLRRSSNSRRTHSKQVCWYHRRFA
ncbi:hypothetical protein AVEN_105498-1 [Araneus ventricosus]|uniref:Uncharacterized protein n=1 Tax=Araneus ventricosus TaxID=182803 RepID=A0A4Y2GNE7_ARAVE|nr:hypothetical protein AVEN_105498-1 [Araneus ventricosus]